MSQTTLPSYLSHVNKSSVRVPSLGNMLVDKITILSTDGEDYAEEYFNNGANHTYGDIFGILAPKNLKHSDFKLFKDDFLFYLKHSISFFDFTDSGTRTTDGVFMFAEKETSLGTLLLFYTDGFSFMSNNLSKAIRHELVPSGKFGNKIPQHNTYKELNFFDENEHCIEWHFVNAYQCSGEDFFSGLDRGFKPILDLFKEINVFDEQCFYFKC